MKIKYLNESKGIEHDYKSIHNEFLNEAEVTIPDDLLNDPSSVNIRGLANKAVAKEKAEEEARKEAERKAELEKEAKPIIEKCEKALEEAKANNGDRLQALFDVLVPSSGKCDTLAGELVRAWMKVEYRDFNDGDVFYDGYGLETCGPSAEFVLTHTNDEISDDIIDLVEDALEDDEYTDEINSIGEKLVDFIMDNKYLFATEAEDSLETDVDIITSHAATYEYEPDISGDYVDSLLEYDFLDWDEIFYTVENIVDMNCNDDAYVDRWAFNGLTIKDLDKESLRWLDDNFDNEIYAWIEDLYEEHQEEIEELEWGVDDEDDFDESLNEEAQEIERYEDEGRFHPQHRIIQYPNGKFGNEYDLQMYNGKEVSNSTANSFDTLDMARNMMSKHRPMAKLIDESVNEDMKSKRIRHRLTNLHESLATDYPEDFEEAQEIIDNLDTYVADVDKSNLEDGIVSVLIQDRNSDFSAWVDCQKDSYGDVVGEWNEYIFHLNNRRDRIQDMVQDSNKAFEECVFLAENEASTIFDENLNESLTESNNKNHIIWSSDIGDLDNWRGGYREELENDGFDEEEIEELINNDEKVLDFAYDTNARYLEDEQMNLDRLIYDNGILVLGDIGRWNGRVSGYKVIKSGKVSDCLQFDDCDLGEWYVNNDGEFCFEGAHHDGYNYYTYRAITCDADDFEDLEDKIYEGKATQEDIDRCTSKIGLDIAKVYGWSVNEALNKDVKKYFSPTISNPENYIAKILLKEVTKPAADFSLIYGDDNTGVVKFDGVKYEYKKVNDKFKVNELNESLNEAYLNQSSGRPVAKPSEEEIKLCKQEAENLYGKCTYSGYCEDKLRFKIDRTGDEISVDRHLELSESLNEDINNEIEQESHTHIGYFYMTKEQCDYWNELLELEPPIDFDDLHEPTDSVIDRVTATFDDGHFADIMLCSGNENFFGDNVLYNNGNEVDVPDCFFDVNIGDEFEFEDGDELYIGKVVEKESLKEDIDNKSNPIDIVRKENIFLLSDEDFEKLMKQFNDYYTKNPISFEDIKDINLTLDDIELDADEDVDFDNEIKSDDSRYPNLDEAVFAIRDLSDEEPISALYSTNKDDILYIISDNGDGFTTKEMIEDYFNNPLVIGYEIQEMAKGVVDYVKESLNEDLSDLKKSIAKLEDKVKSTNNKLEKDSLRKILIKKYNELSKLQKGKEDIREDINLDTESRLYNVYLMDRVLRALNNEEALYDNGWLYEVEDESSDNGFETFKKNSEDYNGGYYYTSDEDYNYLVNLFKEIMSNKEYLDDGIISREYYKNKKGYKPLAGATEEEIKFAKQFAPNIKVITESLHESLMNIRKLTDKEFKAISDEGIDNMELVLGQDHYYHLYSNEIDAYFDTGIKYSKVKDEAEALQIIKDKYIPFPRDAWWIFGDDFDI